jgi:hypothetical protein
VVRNILFLLAQGHRTSPQVLFIKIMESRGLNSSCFLFLSI